MQQDTDPGIRIYPSRLKIGVLVVPCVIAVAVTLQADNAGELTLADLSGCPIVRAAGYALEKPETEIRSRA